MNGHIWLFSLAFILFGRGILTYVLPGENEDVISNGQLERNPEDNDGLFEGDIITFPRINSQSRNAVLDKKWPGGILEYQIDNDYPEEYLCRLRDAMREIEEKTSVGSKKCIQFKKTNNWLFGYLAISFRKSGCSSTVGFLGGWTNDMQMKLSSGCQQGNIMHELLHAIGFLHEHTRKDRDKYIRILTKNIPADKLINFKIFNTRALSQPYDYGSIMHYPRRGYYTGRDAIATIQIGVEIGQRRQLSDTDIRKIQILYGCPRSTNTPRDPFVTAKPTSPPPRNADRCSFEKGLCSWSHPNSSQFDWIRHKGETDTKDTGPPCARGASEGVYYIYAEASNHMGKIAKIRSKVYKDLPCCIDYYYHMHGRDVGTLTLRVVQGSEEWTMSSKSGDNGEEWAHSRINFGVTGSLTGFDAKKGFQFEFMARIGKTHLGDIALDDIMVYPGKCVG